MVRSLAAWPLATVSRFGGTLAGDPRFKSEVIRAFNIGSQPPKFGLDVPFRDLGTISPTESPARKDILRYFFDDRSDTSGSDAMIVGSGLLARTLAPFFLDDPGVVVYAAGVSNSNCTD